MCLPAPTPQNVEDNKNLKDNDAGARSIPVCLGLCGSDPARRGAEDFYCPDSGVSVSTTSPPTPHSARSGSGMPAPLSRTRCMGRVASCTGSRSTVPVIAMCDKRTSRRRTPRFSFHENGAALTGRTTLARTSPLNRRGQRLQSSRSRSIAASSQPTRRKLHQYQPLLEAGATGLEPATSGVTGRRSNQLSYAPLRGDASMARHDATIRVAVVTQLSFAACVSAHEVQSPEGRALPGRGRDWEFGGDLKRSPPKYLGGV